MFITIRQHIFNINCISSVRVSINGTELYIITTNDREHTIEGVGHNVTTKRADILQLFEEISKNLSKTY